jgi:hypothetical protein
MSIELVHRTLTTTGGYRGPSGQRYEISAPGVFRRGYAIGGLRIFDRLLGARGGDWAWFPSRRKAAAAIVRVERAIRDGRRPRRRVPLNCF